MQKAVIANDIVCTAGKKTILSFSRLETNEGGFLGVAGPNGSGKTTLLRVLSGALKPDSGSVSIFGSPTESRPPGEKAKIISSVPAEMHVPYDYTAQELALMGCSPYLDWWRDYRQADRQAAADVMRRLEIEHLAGNFINELSTGEKQKVFIAQALCQKPKILFLDEPTAHLDIKGKRDIFMLLDKLRAETGLTVIAASHDIALLKRHCAELAILKAGGLEAWGPAGAITDEVICSAYGLPPSSAF